MYQQQDEVHSLKKPKYKCFKIYNWGQREINWSDACLTHKMIPTWLIKKQC